MVAPWWTSALCREVGIDDDLWFGKRRTEAARLCAACPVSADCLTDALAEEAHLPSRGDIHGIRGGLTASERSRLLTRLGLRR